MKFKLIPLKKRIKFLYKGILGLIGGFLISYLITSAGGYKYSENKAAFRLSIPQEIVDYDLQCALNYLKYQLNQNGIEVIGTSYYENLYPADLNTAGINFFIRGFHPFYDVRAAKNAIHINYVHRAVISYISEFQNYDLNLTSQKKFKDNLASQKVKAQLFPVGYVKHEALLPNYAYDVLYIYEYNNSVFRSFIDNYKKSKSYGGAEFARLSTAEQKAELRKAKVVVYEMGPVGDDDADYVPYAVYDIISYGRPLITNRKQNLTDYFKNEVDLFTTMEEMLIKTHNCLNLDDAVRENKAKIARDKLFKISNKGFDFVGNMQKIRHKKHN